MSRVCHQIWLEGNVYVCTRSRLWIRLGYSMVLKTELRDTVLGLDSDRRRKKIESIFLVIIGTDVDTLAVHRKRLSVISSIVGYKFVG